MNILIVRGDNAIQITPSPPYITDYLKYSHRSFETVRYQRVNKYETRLLHVPDGNGGVITLQGFFPKVCKLITKNGDLFTVEDRRHPMPAIDWQAVKNLGLRDYQISPTVDFLKAGMNDCGLLVATGGFGKTHMQMFTYAAWNGLNTILAIPLREIFKQTYAKFVTMFPSKHVGRVGDGFKDISEDITIATFASLKHCALEKCQLLLVDEMQQATGEAMQALLRAVKPYRVFGYTATDKGLFNQADKLLKGCFGERLINVPYPEAEEAGAVVPGLVYMVKLPQTMPLSATTMEGKISQGIKHCKVRNQLIGDICRKVPNKWQALVFVDHVLDHLVKIYATMPQGTLYIHRDSSKANAGRFALTKKQQDETIRKFMANEIQYLIGTDAFRAGVDVPNLRVLVQASGGSSKVEILQEAFRASRALPEERRRQLDVDEKTHFVLIDFLDNHDEALQNMAEKRMEYYKQQGWKIKTVETPDQIDWFDYEKKLL